MEKPVIIQYTLTGEEYGIARAVERKSLNEMDFGELLMEITKPEEDGYNPKMDEDQSKLADKVRSYVHNAKTRENTSLDIYCRTQENDAVKTNGPYDLDNLVGEHLDDIISLIEKEEGDEMIRYELIDMKIQPQFVGGYE